MGKALSGYDRQLSPHLLPGLLEDAARNVGAPADRAALRGLRARPGDDVLQPPLTRPARRVRNLDETALYRLVDRIEQGSSGQGAIG